MNRERFISFLESVSFGEPEWLEELRSSCIERGVPVVRRDAAQLLRFLTVQTGAENILEVGTAEGYSSLLMWDASGGKVHIDTIENYERRLEKARVNLARAEGGIRLLEGDALEILPGLEGPYDLVFMDAAKGQYLNFLPEVLRLLKSGGTLVTDNTLQEGRILESRFAVERRDRTIHSRMRGYIRKLMDTPELVSTLLACGDGMLLSVKR